MPVTVTVLNDYPLVIAGVEALLGPYADRVTLLPGHGGTHVSDPVEVVLFDTFGSGPGWQDQCAQLAREPHVGAVVVYSFITDRRAVDEAVAAGARGFLAKSLAGEELVAGIERIAAGETLTAPARDGDTGPHAVWPAGDSGLSPREAEMLALIAQGLSNEDIATACYLSINTVKSYIRDAYRKIGVTTRPQAVAWALKNGFEPVH